MQLCGLPKMLLFEILNEKCICYVEGSPLDAVALETHTREMKRGVNGQFSDGLISQPEESSILCPAHVHSPRQLVLNHSSDFSPHCFY